MFGLGWRSLSQLLSGGGAPAIADPAPLDNHDSYRYVRVNAPLIVDGVSVRDVRQGSIADCNIAAAVASIACFRPDVIPRLAKRVQDPDAEGDKRNFEVFFFSGGNRDPEQRIAWPVDDDFLVRQSGRPVYGGWNDQPEIWFPVIEKAYADWQDSLDGSIDRNGYDLLDDGGNAFGIFEALLGAKPVNYQVGSMSEDRLLGMLGDCVEQKWPMVAFTYGRDRRAMYDGTRLSPWHTYAILDVDPAARTVKLYNPWGDTEFGRDDRDDGIFEMSIADFQKYFRNMNIARDPVL